MPLLPNKEIQSTISKQTTDVNETKRKLEDRIATVDLRNKSLMETEARKDMQSYRIRQLAGGVTNSR